MRNSSPSHTIDLTHMQYGHLADLVALSNAIEAHEEHELRKYKADKEKYDYNRIRKRMKKE